MTRSLPGTLPQSPRWDLLSSTPARAPLLSVDISVVTPMFGGSATPGVVDLAVPARVSTVRGHLRFWWRACSAARYQSAADLFQAESEIWGSTHVDAARRGPPMAASAIETGIEILKAGEAVKDWGPAYPMYAVFPFQRRQGNPAKVPLEGVRFRLNLTISPYADPARRAELERAARAAVWAWVTFGGIGARTRRGCGALSSEAPWLSPQGRPDAWLQRAAREHVARGPAASSLPVPVLTGAAFVLGTEGQAPMNAWRKAVDAMQKFRQGPGVGRTGPGGRSLWPEADSLRDLLGAASAGHSPVHLAKRYFPRAELGLPIVFHFKDAGDPGGSPTLEPKLDGATRLASPIVLKPLAIASGVTMPLALELHTPTLGATGVALQVEGRAVPPNEVADPAKAGRVMPLKGQPNARRAFMTFVAGDWKSREVRL